MPPLSFRPSYQPVLSGLLPKPLATKQRIVFNGDFKDVRPDHAQDGFQSPLDVDADPDENYRKLDWQRMAQRRFGELGNELGAGGTSSGFRGATGAPDTTVKLAGDEVITPVGVNSGAKTYPRTVRFTKMTYLRSPIEEEFEVDRAFDRHDFVNTDEDIGITIYYPKTSLAEGPNPVLMFYRPSSCGGIIPPDSHVMAQTMYLRLAAELTESGSLSIKDAIIDGVSFNPERDTNLTELNIDLKGELKTNSHPNHWLTVAKAKYFSDDIYTGVASCKIFNNLGHKGQTIPLGETDKFSFDIEQRESDLRHFVNPILYTRHSADSTWKINAQKISIKTEDVEDNKGTSLNTVVSFKTSKWRVVLVTNGMKHRVFVRELDLEAMAAVALKAERQKRLKEIAQAYNDIKKVFAHKSIASIDRLEISQKVTDKKQIITKEPLEIGINFNAKDWGTFCTKARTPDGAEVFFYFGPEGSACRYKATLNADGKKITLTPKDHTEILPSLELNLAKGAGSNLREIKGRRLTLIEQLIFGPDIDFKVASGPDEKGVVVQTIFTGDHSGKLKQWAQTRPEAPTIERKIVPGKRDCDFIIESLVHTESNTIDAAAPIKLDEESLLAFYTDHRSKATKEASLVLPEVAAKEPDTAPTAKPQQQDHTKLDFDALPAAVKDRVRTVLEVIYKQRGRVNDAQIDTLRQALGLKPADKNLRDLYEKMITGQIKHPSIVSLDHPGIPITGGHAVVYKNLTDSNLDPSLICMLHVPGIHQSGVSHFLEEKLENDIISDEVLSSLQQGNGLPPNTKDLLLEHTQLKGAHYLINSKRLHATTLSKDKDIFVFDFFDGERMVCVFYYAKTKKIILIVKPLFHADVPLVLPEVAQTDNNIAAPQSPTTGDQLPAGTDATQPPAPPPKPAPKVTIPLSAADKKLLRDELRPAWMIAAASATPVKIESRPIKIDESEYLKFAPGEILVASPDTLQWLKNNCKVTDDGEEFLDLVPMRRLYWYELKSSSGNITLRLPVRYNPSRKKNPFVVDTSVTPEAYISFAKDKTTIKLTDDRFVVKNAKDGSLEFFMLDGSFEDERIKDFHFRTTTSKDSAIVMGAANVLGSDGQRLDEEALRAETRDALDVTTVAVLGHDISDMPKVRYVNPRVTFKNERDVTLTFVSPLANNRVEPIQAHLDGLNFDGDNLTSDTGELTLTFDAPEANGSPELEKIDVTLHPTATENVFALTEKGPGARLYLWNKSLGMIWQPSDIDLKALPGDAAVILKGMHFPASPTASARNSQGTRARHTDNGSLVHIDERISYLPAKLSSVPVNYVVTENPDDALIDDAILNAHDKRFIPDEETFHVMLAGGRTREVATFVSPDDGSMLILPIETDPGNKSWYRLVKQHRDAATFGAELLLPHPKKPGEFILVPAKVYGDGTQIHVVTKTNAVLSLNMASTRANVNKRRLSGFLSALPKTATEYSVNDVRAALYEETEFYGLGEEKVSPNIADNEFFVLGQEIILKDGRELNLTVLRNKDNGRLTFTGFIIDEENDREYIEYMNPDGTEGEMTVYRAQNGGALYYLDDGRNVSTLEIDDNGQPLILKRPQGIERFLTPKKAPRHIMINAQGQAYQSKAKSPATRREITEPGVWPRVFEIATDLGRSAGSGGNTLKGDIDTRDARVKIEISVAKDGKWSICNAKIKTEGKDKNWQRAGYAWEYYGPDNKFLRLYIKGSETRDNRYFDFAWLDFANDDSLFGDNFGLRASYYNMNNSKRNAMPYDNNFGNTVNHEAMLWSASIFSDANGVTLMDRVFKMATDVGYTASDFLKPSDLVAYFLLENPNEIAPAVEQAVSWLDRPKRGRKKKENVTTPAEVSPTGDDSDAADSTILV